MSVSNLTQCILELNSNKLMVRRKCSNQLVQLLEDETILKILDEGNIPTCSWTGILIKVHEFLYLESIKLSEDESKNKKPTFSNTTQKNLITTVVRKASHNGQKLSGQKLLDCILKCFNSSPMQKYFGDSYINILKDYFLAYPQYTTNISSDCWLGLLYSLKTLYNDSQDDTKILQCIQLLFQRGPHCGLPINEVRRQFSFISQIVQQQLQNSKKKVCLEVTIKLLIDFCNETMKDNRLSCCKLGEEVIEKLIHLLESAQYENVQFQIYKFLLLQVKIHHPKGSVEGDTRAYACNWQKWKTNLKYLYFVVSKEINKLSNKRNVQLKYGAMQTSYLSLNKDLVALGIEIFPQICDVNFVPGQTLTGQNTSFEPSSKRIKADFSINSIIFSIQEKKDWPWIDFIGHVLENSPNLITGYDYITLLQTLTTLQAQCKDSNVRYHVYKCLCVLVEIQDKRSDLKKNYKDQLTSMWAVVWDMAHRTVGLNQNMEYTHKLIQKLIELENNLPFINLFNTYHSGVLMLNDHTLNTLDVLCTRFTLPDHLLTDNIFQKQIFRWILNVDNNDSEVFSKNVTAKILVSLILKGWPNYPETSHKTNNTSQEYCSVEDVHCITSLQETPWPSESLIEPSSSCETRIFLKNNELLEELLELIHEYSTQLIDDEKKDLPKHLNDLINFITLIVNVLSNLVRCRVLMEEDLKEHRLVFKLNEILNLFLVVIKPYATKLKKPEHRNLRLFNSLEKLFRIDAHEVVLTFMFKLFPEEIIMMLFDAISHEDSEDSEDDRSNHEDCLYACQSALCSYFSNPHLSVINMTRLKALETFTKYSYQLEQSQDYKLAITFLEALTFCKVGSLSDNILENVFACIRNICNIHCKHFDFTVTLLKLWLDLYPHVINSNSEKVKVGAAQILQPFFNECSNYGSTVGVLLVKCMRQVVKWNRFFSWLEDDTFLAHNVLIFLKSDYQEVRIETIKYLMILFNEPDDFNCKSLQKHQEISFDILSSKAEKVFEVDENAVADYDRKIDEQVTRTAAVLLTFATVIVTSVIRRKTALFSIIKLTYTKKIDQIYLQNTLRLVSEFLNFKDIYSFLKPYATFLISQWHKTGLEIDKFPYELFNCESLTNFYEAYVKNMGYIFLQNNQENILEEICTHTRCTIADITQECLPNILANYLLAFVTNEVIPIRLFKNIEEQFGLEVVNEFIFDKINLIVAEIIEQTYDETYLRDKLSITCLLPEPNQPYYSLEVLTSALKLLEEKFFNGKSFVLVCVNKCPSKLQRILLEIITRVHLAPYPQDKIIGFHKYIAFVDILLERFHETKHLFAYFMKDITCSLLNLISDKTNGDSLRVLVCKYFQTVVPKFLTKHASTFEEFLSSVVGTLVQISKQDNIVAEECIKILDVLIVENSDTLRDGIKILDPFPEDTKVKSLRSVCERIRQNVCEKTLKDNIENFLNGGTDEETRLEAIVYLTKQIFCKRNELEDLYIEIQNSNRFSEDCKNNILHKLLCILLKLTMSSNNNVSLEAARCLGELGPANLVSVTLDISNKYRGLFEPYCVYMAGSILSFLSVHLFDKDITIVQATCGALSSVLQSKDATAALACEKEFVNGKINCSYISPFMVSEKVKEYAKCSINASRFKQLVNNNNLWCPDNNQAYSEWIVNLVCAIVNSFEKCYLQELIPLCKIKIEFAQNVFPLLVGFVLQSNLVEFIDTISSQLRLFFEKHWAKSFEEDRVKNDIEMIKSLLEVVHLAHLQKCNTSKRKTTRELSMNYLHVAKAAHFCAAYFSALQFIEFWSNEKMSEIRTSRKIDNNNQYSSDSPLYSIMANQELQIQEVVLDILKESYNKIGDQDALSACRLNISFDSKKDIEIFEQMQKWDQVALQYDIRMSHNELNLIADLTKALKKNSFLEISFLHKTSENQQYDCAWRLGNWSVSESDKKNEELLSDFDKEHYYALKALHERDNTAVDRAIRRARNSTVHEVKKLNLECSKSIYNVLSHLKMLKELEDFATAIRDESVEDILNKWRDNGETNLVDFEYFEPVQQQRIILLKDIISKGQTEFKDILSGLHLKLAEYARKEGFDNISQRALLELNYVPDLHVETKFKLVLEEAQLWWKKDKSTAKSKLRHLLNITSDHPRLYSDALKLYGSWMIESSSESSLTISEYFLKSIDALTKIDYNEENLFEIYDLLGRYCDSKYQQVMTYIKSSEFEQKIKNLEKCRNAIALLQQKESHSKLTPDENRTKLLYQRQSNIDDNEIQTTYKERDDFLGMALKYYVLNLQKSVSNDLRLFRLFSLWLENRNSENVSKVLLSELPKIPSYKYVPILPQLVPHLNPNEDNQFSLSVFQIIERCAKDHPYHTLPLLLALANANLDRKYTKGDKKLTPSSFRIKGAQKLVEKLKKSSIKETLVKMEFLSTALIELAYLDIDSCQSVSTSRDKYHIKNNCQIKKIKNFDQVLLPTLKLPVSKTNTYSRIVGVASFQDVFTGVGGINAPKRISCVGTDGIVRHQLVKGKDDLRQDAVMQQVFTIMNEFLIADKHTFKNKLRIRTYKVVPLSQRSGVLQWVENSIPLGEYLIGTANRRGAHQRYHKNDYSTDYCRKEMGRVAKASNEVKLRAFFKVCQNFQPVFYKFFEEYFPEPSAWYERRQAFIHSVATTGMCGYILGIGDRHVQNILINEKTAEIVHIDFGIAFEQGKVLPTPETVPFRLTRDIESGMGICGIEGVFRRSCEKTMEVLRNNSDTIVTILEVLLYDPLYAWSITPSQAYSRQFNQELDTRQRHDETVCDTSVNADNDASLNTIAERALLKLRQKLKGTEEGCASSIEGQVEKLIQQARDPANLSRLYYGWQAYL